MKSSLDFYYGEGDCTSHVHLSWTPGSPRLIAVPCSGGYLSADRAASLPDFDQAKLRRLARLGTQLDIWDDQAHVWGEGPCAVVDGPGWTLELALGRRSYFSHGYSFGARFEVIRRLLGLKPMPSRDYWA